MQELLDIVNKYNTIKSLYFAMYKRLGETYNKVYVDKVFFDFDGEDAIYDIRTLHNFCVEHDLKHLILFSGRGFHCYVKIQKTLMTSEQLRNIHIWFVKNLRINIDKHIIGDIARISRIPNTLNLKGRKYCIPITEEDLQKGLLYISELAENQRFSYTIYGSKALNPKFFKLRQTEKQSTVDLSNEEVSAKVKSEIIYKCLRPCIQELCVPHARWRMRFHIIIEIMNCGFSLSQCIEFLKSFLTNDKSFHCIVEEKQPIYLYKRFDYEKTSCEILKQEHFCLPTCTQN